MFSRLNWQGISVLSLLSRRPGCYRDLIDKVSVCYRCCQGDRCVIAVELARFQCVIAVVNGDQGVIAIELARYQCAIAVVC